MQTFKDLVIHQDSPELTYHSTVMFPDVVPIYVDCNEAQSVGRAFLTRDQEAGTITASLYIDHEVDDLSDPLVCILGGDADVFDFEDVNYLIRGGVHSLSVVTAAAVELMDSSLLDGDIA